MCARIWYVIKIFFLLFCTLAVVRIFYFIQLGEVSVATAGDVRLIEIAAGLAGESACVAAVEGLWALIVQHDVRCFIAVCLLGVVAKWAA